MKVSQHLLTIYPSDANCLQNGEEDQWDSAAGVVVKELKHVESCLQSTRSKTQRSVNTNTRWVFICLAVKQEWISPPVRHSPQWLRRDRQQSTGEKLPAEAFCVDGQWKRRKGASLKWMWPDLPNTQTGTGNTEKPLSSRGKKKALFFLVAFYILGYYNFSYIMLYYIRLEYIQVE